MAKWVCLALFRKPDRKNNAQTIDERRSRLAFPDIVGWLINGAVEKPADNWQQMNATDTREYSCNRGSGTAKFQPSGHYAQVGSAACLRREAADFAKQEWPKVGAMLRQTLRDLYS